MLTGSKCRDQQNQSAARLFLLDKVDVSICGRRR
uniref:Uncharacterized protein n=1 Tax=Arundo donax TaxID=35708 RepID=A0A0A8ZCM9_ARUDO